MFNIKVIFKFKFLPPRAYASVSKKVSRALKKKIISAGKSDRCKRFLPVVAVVVLRREKKKEQKRRETTSGIQVTNIEKVNPK